LESVYKECLLWELIGSGMTVVKEKPITLVYKNIKLDCGYRLDLLVMNKVVVEVKSVEKLNDLHFVQTLLI
jgi:GxxExxY protein